MSKYKWMPVLKVGTFTDKNNQTVKITKEHLDHIVNSYDPEKKKVNFVIEHPTFDDIGFGSVEKLKRVGEFLLALPETVSDVLKESVNSGKLPFRSSTIKKDDLTLKNISFLPANVPPAVDGLGSYAFSAPDDESLSLQIIFEGEESHFAEGDNDTIEFQKYENSQWPFTSLKTVVRNIKNWMIEKYSKDEADKIIPEYELDEIGKPPKIWEVEPKPVNEFSKPKLIIEEDMKLTDEQIAKLQEDFEALKTTNSDLQTKLSAANQTLEFSALKDKRNAAEAYISTDKMKKKIKPAYREDVVNALVALESNGTFEFSAADGTKTEVKPVDTFKKILEDLPELDLNIELAKKNGEVDPQLTEAQKTAKEMAGMV